MKYLPRGTWIIVNLLTQEKTTGGILLPQTAKEDRLARVEAVGEGQRYMDGKVYPLNVKPGDIVFITPYVQAKEFKDRYIGPHKDNRILLMDDEVVAIVVDYEAKVEIQA